MAMIPRGGTFHSLYSHGFIRSAVAVPEVKVADPGFNVERIIAMARMASVEMSSLVVFPELGITGYSNDDLFQQDVLLEGAIHGLARIRKASESLFPIILVGLPLRKEGKLFNCAAFLYRGRILGVVPKTYLPNYREFYEKRQFCSGDLSLEQEIIIEGERVPFGNHLLFQDRANPDFAISVEICEDLWVPIPPSTFGAMAGGTVLVNLSASNVTIGKADYRRKLASAHSGRCIAAYLYSAAGNGESTTDLAWDGHGMIWENGSLLAETKRFSTREEMLFADIDLERLIQERSRVGSFHEPTAKYAEIMKKIKRVEFDFSWPQTPVPLKRVVERFPYVPGKAADREERCAEAYNIQVHGLVKRLKSSGIQKVVVGISGGLDSTQALIVAARAMDFLNLPRNHILGYTMPGFATSEKTRNNAMQLMAALKMSPAEIDIRPSCRQMLSDLDHPFAKGEKLYDTTFENVQAGERTSHLFRLANHHGALVLGTGDLSELALGWCTYGVGDHMSHYNVNASVPKTLIQHLIRWVLGSGQFDPEASQVIRSILDTEISPELIPGSEARSNMPHQKTEEVIGPYELQDFNLYYITRFGFRPSKAAYLCHHAWSKRDQGSWPESLPADKRHEYDLPAIKKWLRVFVSRFFGNTQFKRSCVPNGPKVGSGGSLSPRGDWRAPSDSDGSAWLEELERGVPDS